MDGTFDIAAMGNLMATAATIRGMAGMVLDGVIRVYVDGADGSARSRTAGGKLRDSRQKC